jgi:hypothetical protein
MEGHMKRRILVAATIAAAFGLIAAGAAAVTSFSSQVTIAGTSGSGSDRYVFGSVSSPHRACVPDRRVKVYKVVASDSTTTKVLVDVARTSNHGAWAAHGDFGSIGAKATVVRKKVGPHRHKVCRAAGSNSFPFF